MLIDTSLFRSGMTGESIAVLHRRLVLQGFEVPAAEQAEDRFGPGTEAAVRAFQASNGLPVVGRVDEATARGLGLGGFPRTIMGLVCRPDGTPLGDLAVRLYQQDGTGEQILAETRSTEDGKFSMPWPQPINAGLVIRPEGGIGRQLSWKTPLAGDAVWVRLSVGGEYRGATRFELLSSAFAPAASAGAFRAVATTGRALDPTAIGERIGVPTKDVLHFALAHRLAERTQLPAGVLFALLLDQVADPLASASAQLDDARVEHALESVLRQRPEDVRATLAAAIANNVVAELDVDTATSQLHELRVAQIAAQPLVWSVPLAVSDELPCCARRAEPTGSGDQGELASDPVRAAMQPLHVDHAPLDEVIATAIADPGVRRQVLEAFAGHDGNGKLANVVAEVSGLSQDHRADLQFTLEVAALLANHLPLVKQVQKLRQAGEISRASDLARLDERDWARLLRQVDPGAAHIALPAMLEIDATNDDRIDQFARLLTRRFEVSHPTTALAGRLTKDRGELPLAQTERVQRFLDGAPTFCVRHSHIDRYVHDLSADALRMEGHAEVVADLKVLQRAYKLTPRFDHVKAMLVAGHTSAYAVFSTGPERFAAQMAEAGVTPGEARIIFAEAEQVHATTVALMANYHSAFTGATPAAVAPALDGAAVQSALASFPTVQSLFGSADYCACADCRAIHGPAAYFVDILQFLKGRAAQSGTAREVLLGRRPDLNHINLSCDNTNKIVPYIDLVCEVLEDAIGGAPTVNDLKARQTSGTAEELRANPAFVRTSAYNTLASAIFPITALFDLHAAEIRTFFAQLGVLWHDLMAAFQNESGPTDVQIAGERFGFFAGALTIVTTPAPPQPWTLWNLAQTGNTVADPRKPDDAAANRTGTWIEILAFVPILLDRARITHRELIQLLQTRFINPSGAIKITQDPADGGNASCDSGKQRVDNLTDGSGLTRLNRFIRLWRQLGCTIWDLDKVLCATNVANSALDANAITQLGRLDAVAKRLKLPWDELLSLWGEIDSFNYIDVLDVEEPVVPSVYRRRFRNPAVTQAAPVFIDKPTDLTGSLNNVDVIAGISAALDLSADDIKRIRAAAGLSASLNFANLSTIARYDVLAGGLGLSISELLTAIAVTGENPFPNPPTPSATLQFLTAFDQSQSTGFSLIELHYLLRHGSVVDSKIGLADETIATWLDDLRRALVRLGTPTGPAAAALVIQRVSAMLKLDPTLTEVVFGFPLPGGGATIAARFDAAAPALVNIEIEEERTRFAFDATRENFGPVFDAYTALDKMRILLARWQVNAQDALWLLHNAGAMQWMELHTLPASAAAAASSTVTLAKLEILRRNVVVQQTLASPSGVRLFDFASSPGANLPAAVTKVAQLGGWLDSDISAVANRLGLSTPAQLVAGANVARIRDLMAWPRRLGAEVATTLGFVKTAVDSNDARKARQLAKSKFTNAEWLGVAGAIQDRLREQKRAALVGYLLASPQASRNQKWVTVEDLYGFFLIDPEMSAVASTTRIKQAAATVQLFVQRCLLQLEPAVTVNVDSDNIWTQWDWMKRFRLWEANRKIFLYPENWFDPAQRRDMSPFFAELVNEIQQTDLTNTVAEDALRGYLHKLVDVAHLEVSGLWEEPLSGTQSNLHVVARTRKSPYQYSYRKRDAITGMWSPWEPIDPGTETSHVMPAIWNKRLFMLWPEIVEKALPATEADRTAPPPATTTTPIIANEPRKYWEITLSWLEQRNNIWLPKRQSQRKQLINGFNNGAPVTKLQLAFRATTPLRGGGSALRDLVVSTYQPSGPGSQALAQWKLTSPQDEPLLLHIDRQGVLAGVEDMRYIAALPPGTNSIGVRPKFKATDLGFHFNAFGGDVPGSAGRLELQHPEAGGVVPLRTMFNTVAMPRVISVRLGDSDQFKSPFFVSDPQRTFFALNDTWNLQPFYHPFAETFVQQLNLDGVPGLYGRKLQVDPDAVRGVPVFDFAATYGPSTTVTAPAPTETIDYTPAGPYQIYNWELFLHTPLLIAKRLADNQRFEEALRWFHYIFNPTTVFSATSPGTQDPVPQRYWNPRVFRELTASDYTDQQIERLLQLINAHDATLEQRVAAWRTNPFDPNLVAATRPVAYQKAVVMQYISTLIAWGDRLFRQDTIESINEATQLYLLASQLLGPRPQNLRAIQPRQDKSYADLAPQLDTFSSAMVDIENIVSVPPPGVSVTVPPPSLHTFYFCIPPNDQLLSYWDKVADRLFKVRNGLNLAGVARPLALFEPPIDPGLLARAAAAGVDIAAAFGDGAVELMCYRFATLWQVAHDLCQDVRSLGAAILSAHERRDGEELARLRATQEVAVTDAILAVKIRQVEEANHGKEALLRGRDLAVIRRDFYSERPFMNAAEIQGQVLVKDALDDESAATVHDKHAVVASFIPSFSVGIAGFGGSPQLSTSFGGDYLARLASGAASVRRGQASSKNQRANQSNTLASYQRRAEDWEHQRQLAAKEIEQLDKQLLAAELRIAITEHELKVQQLQIEHARTNAELIETKFTNQELFDWMLSQLSATYFHAYQIAYDLAKRASKSYAFELGVPDPGFIQFGYWDSLHKGLVAGDRLLLDLRRLQAEHLNNNKRELELTKHVSLLQLDPRALVRLRETGACELKLPEELFDHDQPGHYHRRIKTMSVTLPCVTGPYASINATLTLLSHTTRTSTALTGGYLATSNGSDGLPSDPRFAHVIGVAQSVALSTGREDAGMFELNLRDERYLPFEGVGAISRWRLELPADTNQFDVATLADVVLHTRYTARYGGDALRDAARAAVITSSTSTPRPGFQVLSARTEFPDAYARLFAPTGSGQRLDLALGAEHFPFVRASHQITVTGLSVILVFSNDKHYADYAAVASAQRLTARVGLTPGDGTVPTTSRPFAPDTANLGGVPATEVVALSVSPSPITIGFVEGEIANQTTLLVTAETQPDSTVLHRLIRERIDDILIAIDYQIAPTT